MGDLFSPPADIGGFQGLRPRLRRLAATGTLRAIMALGAIAAFAVDAAAAPPPTIRPKLGSDNPSAREPEIAPAPHRYDRPRYYMRRRPADSSAPAEPKHPKTIGPSPEVDAPEKVAPKSARPEPSDTTPSKPVPPPKGDGNGR